MNDWDPSYPPQPILDAWARTCRDGCGITCGDRPCAACCAGGICDATPCRCDEYDSEDYAEHDDYWQDDE